MIPKINSSEVLPMAVQQLEGMKEAPEVTTALPFPSEKLGSLIDEVRGLEARQQDARTEWIELTAKLNEATFGLREAARANLGVVSARVGRYSPVVRRFGGKPLGGRRSAKKSAASEPAPTPTVRVA